MKSGEVRLVPLRKDDGRELPLHLVLQCGQVGGVQTRLFDVHCGAPIETGIIFSSLERLDASPKLLAALIAASPNPHALFGFFQHL